MHRRGSVDSHRCWLCPRPLPYGLSGRAGGPEPAAQASSARCCNSAGLQPPMVEASGAAGWNHRVDLPSVTDFVSHVASAPPGGVGCRGFLLHVAMHVCACRLRSAGCVLMSLAHCSILGAPRGVEGRRPVSFRQSWQRACDNLGRRKMALLGPSPSSFSPHKEVHRGLWPAPKVLTP